MPRHLLALLVAVLLTVPVTADAQDATPVESGSILPPDATVDGHGLGEWHARYWQWTYGLPVDVFGDATGELCGVGQHGPVFFLTVAPRSVERACTVPSEAVLFVPVGNNECSTVEESPFYGADEAELRACAKGNIGGDPPDWLPGAGLTVDGTAVGDLSAYRAATPLFQLVFVPNPDSGIQGGVAQSVGDGYAALVGPLSEGEHMIEVSSPDGQGGFNRITYRLMVASGVPAEPATPAA
jgi:hypothetical protein